MGDEGRRGGERDGEGGNRDLVRGDRGEDTEQYRGHEALRNRAVQARRHGAVERLTGASEQEPAAAAAVGRGVDVKPPFVGLERQRAGRAEAGEHLHGSRERGVAACGDLLDRVEHRSAADEGAHVERVVSGQHLADGLDAVAVESNLHSVGRVDTGGPSERAVHSDDDLARSHRRRPEPAQQCRREDVIGHHQRERCVADDFLRGEDGESVALPIAPVVDDGNAQPSATAHVEGLPGDTFGFVSSDNDDVVEAGLARRDD